jgi:cysteine-rich repeat protein
LNNDPCVGLCVLATCGDGFLCSAGGCTTGPTGGTEQCDNDGANSDVTPDACRTDCANPSCGDNVTDPGNLETCDTGGNSATCDADCTGALCGDGFTNPATIPPEQCDGPGETATCDPDCTNAICNDGYINVTKGEECEDGNTMGGDGCSATCTCGVGSGEIGCQDENCPASGEIVLFAGVREQACTDNTDCEVDGALVGFCDTGLVPPQCATATDLDTGWTGIAHNSDINDFVVTRGSLLCPGPFDGMSATPCGECEVLGLSPETDLCRCSNDNQAICDDTFSLDPDDCDVPKSCSTNADCKVCNITTSTSCNVDADCPGGEYCLNGLKQPTCSGGTCVGTCNCFFGPPLPLSSGSTPACALNRFAVDVSGSANVDLGEGEITASLKAAVFLGELVTVPCPYCDSDVTPRDGIRDGTCVFGENPGDACDSQATNMTFPAPSGSGHSLDCFPAAGKNVSGTGLTINLVQSTGSDSLTAGIVCGFPPFAPESCPCGQCAGDTSVPCTSNADCSTAMVAGPCQRDALGKPRADGCADSPSTGVCEVVSSVCTGDGETSCTTNADCAGPGGTCVGVEGQCPATHGPTDQYCDGVFRSNGDPYVTCNSNADCDATDCGSGVGVGLCGTCSLTSLRKCFLNPLYVFGKPDPETPIGVAAFCIPKTANTGINDVAGLPGPARVKNATRAKTFCASLPSQEYVPGVGGCP